LGQAVVAGLVALALLAALFRAGGAADQDGREMELANPGGDAWELNRDQNGHLWISDYGAEEVWDLNPVTDVYTIYEQLSGASDGRLDANGDLWWADYDNYEFGRLELGTLQATIWPLTGTIQGNVSGLNFDDQGRVWVTDKNQSNLFRFDPGSDELCYYEMPNNGVSQYIEAHNGYLWLADAKFTYIYRINSADGSYVQWHYQRDSSPRGMAFDSQGNLWWGGYEDRSALFQLNPTSNFVTLYTLPGDTGQPAMVDAQNSVIWYSDETGFFGRLIPGPANVSQTFLVNPTTRKLVEACYPNWQPASTKTVNTSTEVGTWSPGSYPVTASANGWTRYQLPGSLADIGPWGIRAGDDGVWVVDRERQALVNIQFESLFLPLVTAD